MPRSGLSMAVLSDGPPNFTLCGKLLWPHFINP